MAVAIALVLAGCAEFRVPRIDPSGEHFFVQSPPPAVAGPAAVAQAYHGAAVTVTPVATVAPVNSQVILLTSVRGPEDYLLTNERVEWSIAPGTVGHFVDVGRNGLSDILLGEFWRGKIDNNYAIGTTTRYSVRLARPAPAPGGDLTVLPGQAWASITSPVEGTTYVTVYVPGVSDCLCRPQTATIQWLDAEWQFPPPAINAAGTRHVLSTSVVRRSNQCPCVGWRVRYQIAEGPAAGFAPAGTSSIEVDTNAAGQAPAEIVQARPLPGTNRITIQIFRPPLPGNPVGAMLIATGGTLQTWTAPQIAVRKVGPATVEVGRTLCYRILVSNPGDLAAEDVVVSDDLPPALAFALSNPPTQPSGDKLSWRLGRLAARETRPIEVSLRAQQQGRVTTWAAVTAAGGLQDRYCTTTTITPPPLNLKVTGPEQALLQAPVTFEIAVTNAGQGTATGLLIKDRFAPGLENAAAKSPIERDLASLAPGQTQRVAVTFRAAKLGCLCHTVEVLDSGKAVLAQQTVCVNVTETPQGPAKTPPVTQPQPQLPAQPQPQPQFPTQPQPQPQPQPRPQPQPQPPSRPKTQSTPSQPLPETPPIAIKITGPARRNVGETAEFVILVTNLGLQRLTGVKVVDRCDPALVPTMATEGSSYEGDALVWNLGTLLPGKTSQMVIQCQCTRAAPKAWNRAQVTTQEKAKAQAEANLEIRAAPSVPAKPQPAVKVPGESGPALGPGLNMSIADLKNPVNLGKEATYVIRIANISPQPDAQVVLSVILPPGVTPLLDRQFTSGPTPASQDGQTLRFAPLTELAPGRPQEYQVSVRAQQPGRFTVRFELTSRGLPQPLKQEQTTDVNSQQ
jgi:uncharacterized repeat protein (TIGR01451 family)